jgi:hypothetical protein
MAIDRRLFAQQKILEVGLAEFAGLVMEMQNEIDHQWI